MLEKISIYQVNFSYGCFFQLLGSHILPGVFEMPRWIVGMQDCNRSRCAEICEGGLEYVKIDIYLAVLMAWLWAGYNLIMLS